ncbi:MAG: hypothetical protein QOI74_3991, partial [Micromonosporaceae bacterium]|nr:hypothetical protein [Micromonosporaceae bacterium]
MTSSLVRDRLTWMTYAQLGAWGYFFYGFGPIVPLLRDEQHTSRSVASLHGTAFALGGALTGLLLPVLVRRLGRAAVIWLGLAGVCASTVALLLSHHLPATLTSVMLASTSGGLVVNGIVAVLADHHGPGGAAAFSEANAVAAAVGLIAPVTVGTAVAAGYGWRPGLGVVIVVIVALAVVAMTFRLRAARAAPALYGVAADPTPYGVAVDQTPRGVTAGRLPRPYWLVWASIVATGSVEVCLNLWLADVLRSHAHVSPGGATAAVSAVVAGMCVGRLAGGRLTLRLAGTTVMLGALALSAVGFTV